MPPLTKGARPVVDRLYEIADAIADDARNGHKHATYNPLFSKKKHEDILDLAIELKKLIQQAEPFMERAAPPIEQRLTELEEWRAAIEQKLGRQ